MIIFVIMLIRANNKKTKHFKINNTNINIFYGDIFKQEGFKVIAFNDFFDTKVDDKIISKKSLNGIYINSHSAGAKAIDNAIDSENSLKESIIKENLTRQCGGKTTQYKLGTICSNDDYLLLAFSHFDSDNRAYLSFEDYISCLATMWNELDKHHNGRAITIPLLGSGITRINDNKITPQELLKYIIFTFRASKVKFISSLSIVLDEKIKDEINLYDL